MKLRGEGKTRCADRAREEGMGVGGALIYDEQNHKVIISNEIMEERI